MAGAPMNGPLTADSAHPKLPKILQFPSNGPEHFRIAQSWIGISGKNFRDIRRHLSTAVVEVPGISFPLPGTYFPSWLVHIDPAAPFGVGPTECCPASPLHALPTSRAPRPDLGRAVVAEVEDAVGMTTIASGNRAKPDMQELIATFPRLAGCCLPTRAPGQWHGQLRPHQLSLMQLDRGSEPDETCNQKSLAGALTCFAGRIAGAVVGPATAQKERSD